MIIDSIWRLVPYLLLAVGVWLLVVGLVVLGRSDGALTVWFWLRLSTSAAACYAACVWISNRHETE